MLTKRDYQDCMDIQSASNMGGVANFFATLVQKVWQEAHEQGHGTEWVNTHPCVKLVADKISDLARVRSSTSFSKAFEEVVTTIQNWPEEIVIMAEQEGTTTE